jgi:hypothetical protein
MGSKGLSALGGVQVRRAPSRDVQSPWPSIACTALALALVLPAHAATLEVGQGRPYARPSAAAAAAQDGDTVVIDPGEYYDCATWTQSHLTIAGSGPGVVITDTVCQGKALFITQGDDITVRNITFARARAADRNGAGIRAEGEHLTVRSSRFVNNESGLLEGRRAGATLAIVDCEFVANGVADITTPSPALSVGAIAALRVEGSRFFASRGGAHILSGAARSELVGNRIEDGERGVRDAPVVLANGGSLLMEDNLLRRGQSGARFNAAVHTYAGPPGLLEFRRNTLVNASSRPAALLLDWSEGTAEFSGNLLAAGDVERSTEGAWRARAIAAARTLYAEARHGGGRLLRMLRALGMSENQ